MRCEARRGMTSRVSSDMPSLDVGMQQEACNRWRDSVSDNLEPPLRSRTLLPPSGDVGNNLPRIDVSGACIPAVSDLTVLFITSIVTSRDETGARRLFQALDSKFTVERFVCWEAGVLFVLSRYSRSAVGYCDNRKKNRWTRIKKRNFSKVLLREILSSRNLTKHRLRRPMPIRQPGTVRDEPSQPEGSVVPERICRYVPMQPEQKHSPPSGVGGPRRLLSQSEKFFGCRGSHAHSAIELSEPRRRHAQTRHNRG